ncbi:hypothetical protein FRC17_005817 [Serendipita sp. 399]|nr:hypothetical protein FRC17_005817 [Serendipita sp. 399]
MNRIIASCTRRRAVYTLQRRFNSSYQERYGEKLGQKLDELGLKNIEEFKSKIGPNKPVQPLQAPSTLAESAKPKQVAPKRHDSSPMKPLSDIMDVSRIMQRSPTGEDIGAWWTGYHAAKASQGKGYLSAVIPRATYDTFLSTSKKYPTFILPLPRPEAQTESNTPEKHSSTPYEFFFLEWAQHPAPPIPSADPTSNLFSLPKEDAISPNPPCTTVLFTPLQEYKLRQEYASPHLVLTHYTDFASSHNIVLMRGQLTPSVNQPDRFLLSPSDAQLLAFGLQRFYLPNTESNRSDLLVKFHERPDEFTWEELVSASQI